MSRDEAPTGLAPASYIPSHSHAGIFAMSADGQTTPRRTGQGRDTTTHMKEQHNVSRATAALVAAATLTGGVILPATALAENPAPATQQTQTTKTPLEEFETARQTAREKADIQNAHDGTAYTATTFDTLRKTLDDANQLPETSSDDDLRAMADRLRSAINALTVASWTVNGVQLQSSNNALTATLPTFDKAPDSLQAIGSDGSHVDLTISGTSETSPNLGVFSGSASAQAKSDGTRPAISIPLFWTRGNEATAYGKSFVRSGDEWVMSHDTTLDANNHPAETSVNVNGVDTTITWNPASSDNGTVTMTGTASGDVDGQRWRIDYTASRAVDRTAVNQAVAEGRAMLLDTMHEYTTATRKTLDDAITKAQAMPDSSTADEDAAAVAAIKDAESKLQIVTWTTTINGSDVGLQRLDDGSWTLDTGMLDRKLTLTASDGTALDIRSNDPTLGDNGRIRLKVSGRHSATVNDPTQDPRLSFGQWVDNGDMTLTASDAGRSYTVTARWSQLNGKAIASVEGAPISYDPDSHVWTAAPSTALDQYGNPAVSTITLDNGTKTVLHLDYGKAHGGTSGTLVRTATAKGTIKDSGQDYTITVTASSDTSQTRASLETLVASANDSIKPGSHHWTSKTATAFDTALSQAKHVLASDTATIDQLAQATGNLSDAAGRLKAIVWTTTDGDEFEWNQPADTYSATLPDQTAAPSDELKVESNDSTATSLKRVDGGDGQTITDLDLGRFETAGTARWEGVSANGKRPMSATAHYDYKTGKTVKVKAPDGSDLQFEARAGYLAASTTAKLDSDYQPTFTEFDVDGTKVPIAWADATTRTSTDTTSTVTRTGRAEGTITVNGHEQRWVINVTASRIEGRIASLNVIGTDANGSASAYAIDGFDEKTTEYTVTLDSTHVGDRFTLGFKSAADGDDVTQGKAIASGLGANATRILKVRLNGTVYTVNVKFSKPKPTVDNTAARLSGIYVNYDGKAVKGQLIDGWNPDILTYTITLKDGAAGVYVLPEAPEGVTVKASDVKQTGYSTEQSWTSTASNGESRTYVVRVVRDHESTPTADESFVPEGAKDLDGTTPAPSQAATGLKAIGYELDGNFTPMSGDSFQIPEGGTFAYKSYAGQTVQVAIAKKSGMTYEYTLNVLAPDGVTFAARTVTVTYVTAVTHKAMLDAILVDNKRIDGFDPNTRSYKATVGNLDHWTVSTLFDKQSGMSVTVHKERSKATITAVSADGLVSTTYTVEVTARKNGEGVDGTVMERLSKTGSAVAAIASVAALLTGAAGIALATIRRRRNSRI